MNLRSSKYSWEEEYKIRFHDLDTKGRPTPLVFCQMMQDAAWNHAKSLGMGRLYTRKNNLMFALYQELLTAYRYPLLNEVLKVVTWIEGKDRLYLYRNFRVLDDKDNQVAEAYTRWFGVNLKTKRPLRTKSYSGQIDLSAVSGKTSKQFTGIPQLENLEGTYSFKVRYRDLDINGHANSTRYIDWVIDGLELEFRKIHRLDELQITFLSQALYNDQITHYLEEKEPAVFLHSLVRKEDKKELCRARTVWSRVD